MVFLFQNKFLFVGMWPPIFNFLGIIAAAAAALMMVVCPPIFNFLGIIAAAVMMVVHSGEFHSFKPFLNRE